MSRTKQAEAPRNPRPEVASLSILYTQEPDACSDEDISHTLQIDVTDAGAGKYLIVSTTRWALDANDFDGFVELLRDALRIAEG